MTAGMTIKKAAERAGVGIETIRFYERRGLVAQPARPRSGGYRSYGEDTIKRIRFIRQAQEAGFSLREIAELLSLRADSNADCSDVRRRALNKRDEVNRKIAGLRQIRSALDELIAACPGSGALPACTIMDAFAERRTADSRGSSGKGPSRNRTMKQRSEETAIFKVDGMHCDGCARIVELLVSSEPGVRKAAVSIETREARILFDPQVLDAERIAAAIEKAGYSIASRPS